MAQNYQDLDVWKKSVALTTELYGLTSGFPDLERHGLAAEIRRSATSIVTNISEGWGHETTSESLHYWKTARTSLTELETQLIVAFHLQMVKPDENALLAEAAQAIKRMLNRLIAVLKSQADGSGRGVPCPVARGSCPVTTVANRPSASRFR